MDTSAEPAPSPVSWRRARILAYDRQPAGDGRIGLLWPAWAYRVTAPVMPRRGLDVFERVILSLCRAGVRQPKAIGELVELHPRLCSYILDRAVELGHLDTAFAPTEAGLT